MPYKAKGDIKHIICPTDFGSKKKKKSQPLLTLRELQMVGFMEKVTDTPEWWSKVYDPQLAESWKNEAMSSDLDITPNMAQWIIDELRFKSLVYQNKMTVTLHSGDVCKSDTIIPMELCLQLRDACAELKLGPLHNVEVIPGRRGREINLIPFGLNPLAYGFSRILPDRVIGLDDALESIGLGEVIPRRKETGITREDMSWKVASREDIRVKPYSREYQMLPCDLQLGSDGKWHIASYINNLHPVSYRWIYGVLERIFNASVKQWNATLTPLKDMLHSRARIEYHQAKYYPVTQSIEDTRPQYTEGGSEPEYDDRLKQWRLEHYRAVQPDAGKFRPWAVPINMMHKLPADLAEPVRIEAEVNLDKEYAHKGLQMLFGLHDIQLSPEEPRYEVDWHIFGHMVSVWLFFFFFASSHQYSFYPNMIRMSISRHRHSSSSTRTTSTKCTCPFDK